LKLAIYKQTVDKQAIFYSCCLKDAIMKDHIFKNQFLKQATGESQVIVITVNKASVLDGLKLACT
jgi:hypothetical protein